MKTAPSAELAELAPFVRRCVDLDPSTPIRLRSQTTSHGTVTSAFAVLVFGALVERSVRTPSAATNDITFQSQDLLSWLTGDARTPTPNDSSWRGSLPPARGWRRADEIPDSVVRRLVRTGAIAAKDAARLENLPSGRPSDALVNALLDAVVLTVHTAATDLEVTLRSLTAATRMGFVARGQGVHIDHAGRWTRVAGTYGSVYSQTTTDGLDLT